MHDNDPEVINAATQVELGYDHRDAHWKPVWNTFWFLWVLTIVSAIICVPFLFMTTRGKLFDTKIAEVAPTQPPKEPVPLVQSHDAARLDMKAIRDTSSERLGSSGIDEKTGKPHTPINAAIDYLGTNGLEAAGQGGSN